MDELELYVPTYYGDANAKNGSDGEEYGDTSVKVLIQPYDGVRIVLGTHNPDEAGAADIQVERRAGGWAVFLHPNSGDPCGSVFILDDGRSYVLPELYPPCIQIIDSIEEIPELDTLPADEHHVRSPTQSPSTESLQRRPQ